MAAGLLRRSYECVYYHGHLIVTFMFTPDSAPPNLRYLLCVGDAQSANRSAQRFEGDRAVRLQHNDNVRGQCAHLQAAPDGTNEHVFRGHFCERVRVRHDDPTASVWTEGRH